jgi:hypothetical protein
MSIAETNEATAPQSVQADCMLCLQPCTEPVHPNCGCKYEACRACFVSWLKNDENGRRCMQCRADLIGLLQADGSCLATRLFQEGLVQFGVFVNAGSTSVPGAREALKAALMAGMEGIEANRKYPENFALLSSIAFLTGDHRVGIKYFRLAEVLDAQSRLFKGFLCSRYNEETIAEHIKRFEEEDAAAAAAAAAQDLPADEETPSTDNAATETNSKAAE